MTTGFSPVTFLTMSAYARASSWSEASSSPAASGIPVSRRWLIRSSMAAITCGTQPPAGLSAVRQAASSRARVASSPSAAASTSPAEFIQRLVPAYAAKTTGRTTPSASASR